MFRDFIGLSINGKSIKLRGENAFLPLSDVLRYELGMTGTKVVCAEGDCGACTAMFQRDSEGFSSFNTCICTAMLMDGCQVVTIEGLAESDRPNEIQQSMIRNFGGQCGFCTPGFVMSIANMYERKKDPSEQNVKNYLTGNLCRCTGYTPIVEAALDVNSANVTSIKDKFENKLLSNELAANSEKPVKIQFEGREFFAPTTIEMATEYKMQNPGTCLFSGATDLGVQINKGKNPGQRLMSLHLIKDLYQISEEKGWVQVGARVNLNKLEKFIEPLVPEFANFLSIFASPQIKSTATLIGNIANGSPIADTTPFLLTADAEIEICGFKSQRKIALKDFYLGYKKFDLSADEIISNLRFRIPNKDQSKIGLYKVSQRRDLDISCVNSSFIFNIIENNIAEAKIAFGGVGPTAVRLSEIENKIIGKPMDRNRVDEIKSLIANSITPISDLRGSSEFRSMISQDLFEKYAQENFSEWI